MDVARWTVVKMLDGTWNVRDEQTGEWERDAVGLRKPTATKIADALNQHWGAVDLLRWALPYLPEPLPSMGGGAYAENYDRATTLSANTPTGGR